MRTTATALSADNLRSVLDAALDEHGASHRPPAAVLGIADEHGTAITATGIADLVTAEPATAHHAQDIASVSKVLTTLAALVLVSRGDLRLDDRLGKLLGARAGDHAGACVEDLLRHRSGMAPWAPLYLATGPRNPVDRALAVPPRTAPDTERAYSDLGMIVLGHVIETVTGQTLPAAIRRLVLDPLGATTVTAGAPALHLPALTGADGDVIEQQMVATGVPYETRADGTGFAWRTGPVRREVGDGNAFHAFGGGDSGRLRIALLTNRLHGAPTADRAELPSAEALWRTVMAHLDAALHPSPCGGSR